MTAQGQLEPFSPRELMSHSRRFRPFARRNRGVRTFSASRGVSSVTGAQLGRRMWLPDGDAANARLDETWRECDQDQMTMCTRPQGCNVTAHIR